MSDKLHKLLVDKSFFFYYLLLAIVILDLIDIFTTVYALNFHYNLFFERNFFVRTLFQLGSLGYFSWILIKLTNDVCALMVTILILQRKNFVLNLMLLSFYVMNIYLRIVVVSNNITVLFLSLIL
ncbi:MAG: hypothetical protein ACTSSG_11275 [Candidatus Heimdallarchaeaceae archaeon]